MAKWVSSKIDIYFCDKYGTGEESSLPLLPEEFTCNIKGKNEEIDVLSVGGENNDYTAGTINLLKRPSLKTWTIDCEFSHPDKPTYENNDGEEGWTPAQWVNFFEDAMYNKKILEMTVTGINLVKEVSVEDFKHTKSAGQELDTLYTIELKEYVRSKIEHEDVKIEIVIPQPAKEVKDEVGTREQFAWLNGIGYKSVAQPLTKTSNNTYIGINPYVRIIGTNYNVRTSNYDIYYAYFNWLKVKILEEPKCDGAYSLSQLGQYLVSETPVGGGVNAMSNIAVFSRILSSSPSIAIKDLMEKYLYDIKRMGKQTTDCMPGTIYATDNTNRSYTQYKKLIEFFNSTFSNEYHLTNSAPLIHSKYESFDISKRFSILKRYLMLAGESTKFKTSGTPETDILSYDKKAEGKMLDYIYSLRGPERILYKLEAQESFYLPDTSSNLDMDATTNYNINGMDTKIVNAVSDKTNSVYKTFYDKGTIIYAFSNDMYKNQIQTENQSTTPFTVTEGQKIKSTDRIDNK